MISAVSNARPQDTTASRSATSTATATYSATVPMTSIDIVSFAGKKKNSSKATKRRKKLALAKHRNKFQKNSNKQVGINTSKKEKLAKQRNKKDPGPPKLTQPSTFSIVSMDKTNPIPEKKESGLSVVWNKLKGKKKAKLTQPAIIDSVTPKPVKKGKVPLYAETSSSHSMDWARSIAHSPVGRAAGLVGLSFFLDSCTPDDEQPKPMGGPIPAAQLNPSHFISDNYASHHNDGTVVKFDFAAPENSIHVNTNPDKIKIKDLVPNYSNGNEILEHEEPEVPVNATVNDGVLSITLNSQDRDEGIPEGSTISLEEGAFTFTDDNDNSYPSTAGEFTVSSTLSPQKAFFNRALNHCPMSIENTSFSDKWHFSNNTYDPSDFNGGVLPDLNGFDDNTRTTIKNKLVQNGYTEEQADEWMPYLTPGTNEFESKGKYTFNNNPTTAYQLMGNLHPGDITEDFFNGFLGNNPELPRFKFSIDTETQTDNDNGGIGNFGGAMYTLPDGSGEFVVNTSYPAKFHMVLPETYRELMLHEPAHLGGPNSQKEEGVVQKLTLYDRLLNNFDLSKLNRGDGSGYAQRMASRVGKFFNGMFKSTPSGEASVSSEKHFKNPYALSHPNGHNFLNEIYTNIGSNIPLTEGSTMGPYAKIWVSDLTNGTVQPPTTWNSTAETAIDDAVLQRVKSEFDDTEISNIYKFYNTSFSN